MMKLFVRALYPLTVIICFVAPPGAEWLSGPRSPVQGNGDFPAKVPLTTTLAPLNQRGPDRRGILTDHPAGSAGSLHTAGQVVEVGVRIQLILCTVPPGVDPVARGIRNHHAPGQIHLRTVGLRIAFTLER